MQGGKRLVVGFGFFGLAAAAGAASGASVLLGVAIAGLAASVAGLIVIGSFAVAVVAFSATVDTLTKISTGAISPMGMTTMAYAAGAWGLWLLRPWVPRRALWGVVPFALLAGWGLVSAGLWYRPTVPGLQFLFVLTAFAGLLLICARSSHEGADFADRVGRATGWAAWGAVALYAVSGVFPPALPAVGARSFALYALLGIAWYAAGWRYRARLSLALAVGLVLAVGLSLSRTGLVVGVLLLPLAQFRPNRLSGWIRLVGLAVAGVVVLNFAVNRIAPLRDRFYEGDTSLRVGGVAINATGRTNLWGTTWESYRDSPWIGKGAGSASRLIEERFTGLGHPHEDYLRLLHDFGLVGFVLWVVGYVAMVGACGQAWLRADQAGRRSEARLHLAAVLALVAVAIAMLTDNVIVYAFVMAPLGVLVGTSLGMPLAPRTVPAWGVQGWVPGAEPAVPGVRSVQA